MKILVTGIKGQLGYDVMRELNERGYKNIRGIDIDDLDIADEVAVKNYIKEYSPNVIMHNAAWTQVDKAEDMPDLVYKVNALGPKYIAEAAKTVNAKMIYISTDYVFPGTGTEFYKPDDIKNALSIYGKTKSDGEDFVINTLDKYFIIRISWVFGINGNNFIKTMLRLSETRSEINVVNDQIGSPTYTYDLSKLMCDMIETDKYGIYHATNEGICSWYDFAKYVFEVANVDIKVNPISTEDYQKQFKQAYRPLNSRMDKSKLEANGFNLLPSWQDAVKRYIKNELGK